MLAGSSWTRVILVGKKADTAPRSVPAAIRGLRRAREIFGIEPGDRSRIFERFCRVDNGLTRETTGAGIGLSLVRQIAEAHGATVRVDSEPGRFSRFTVRFPATPCASS